MPAQGAAGGLTVAVANARLALKKVAEFQVSSCDEERPGCRDEGDPGWLSYIRDCFWYILSSFIGICKKPLKGLLTNPYIGMS